MTKEICYEIEAVTVEEYRKALAKLEEDRVFGRNIARYTTEGNRGWAYNRIIAYLHYHSNVGQNRPTNIDKITRNLRQGCRYEDFKDYHDTNFRLGEFGRELRKCLGRTDPSPHMRKCSCKAQKNPPCGTCSFIQFDKDLDCGRYDLFLRDEFRQALEKHFGGKEKLKEVLRQWRKKYRPKKRVARRLRDDHV